MGSLVVESKMSAPDAYNTAQKYIRATSLEIKETTGGEKIVAAGERQYDTTILIILLLLVGIFALIYYFTRKKNTLTVNIASRDQGSVVSIVAEGPKAEAVMQFLSEILR